MRITLGEKVRDIVSGFEGVATTRAEHLTGCRRYWVEATAKDGESKGMWVDDARLVSTGEVVELVAPEEAVRRPAPSTVTAPRRDPVP